MRAAEPGGAGGEGPASAERLEAWEGSTAEELAEVWGVPGVRLFAAVGSTNDVARELAVAGAPAGTLVVAERQRAGRGRAGRAWDSPPRLGLWLSVIARPEREHLQALPVRLGVGIAEALDRWTGTGGTMLKWPNDLLSGGRKVGGILCEASWAGNELDHVVAGIGLNLLHAERDFPPDLRTVATSLAAAGELPIARFEVASAVVAAVLDALRDPGIHGPWRDALARRDALLDRWVEVREPETDRLIGAGRGMGIDGRGCLRLRTATGELAITSGTVRFAEPVT